jgi:hypothetical protein
MPPLVLTVLQAMRMAKTSKPKDRTKVGLQVM